MPRARCQAKTRVKRDKACLFGGCRDSWLVDLLDDYELALHSELVFTPALP